MPVSKNSPPNPLPVPVPGATGGSRRVILWLLGIGLTAAIIVAAGFVLHRDPDVRLLVPEDGARWIRLPRRFELAGSGETQEVVLFRTFVEVPAELPRAPVTLVVRALRSCAVSWDSQLLYQASPPEVRAMKQYSLSEPYFRNWKEPREISLSPVLKPGRHELLISVENSRGPTAVLAHCEVLGLRTGEGWECRYEDEDWQPAADVNRIRLPELSERFATPMVALRDCLPWLIPLFAVAWSIAAWLQRRPALETTSARSPVALVRWVLMFAWVVLAARNFLRLPPDLGYDLAGHVAYIRFLLENHALPLASDGPQMFQSPLYYLISAGLYRCLEVFVSGEAIWQWLRWFPLLCGMGQIELCYRAGVILFPARRDLQTVAVAIGGLLPMNIVMSQALGNEPLCGLLSGIVLVMCLQGLREPAYFRRPRTQWLLGVLVGLALLTKVSALLLVVPVAIVVARALYSVDLLAVALGQIRWLLAAAVVSGWFFVRNWMYFDQAIIGGWDAVTNIVWWQDPGYRTLEQMGTFGHSLQRPIHAGFHSIWDGFYSTLWLDGNLSAQGTWESRPPWNYSWMLSATWLALVLTAAIVAGLIRSLRTRNTELRPGLRLAGGTLLLYVAAFALLCLRVPVYSQAKASYTLGLTPMYGVLCAAGFDLLPKHWLARSAVWAFLGCWCVLVYGAYFTG